MFNHVPLCKAALLLVSIFHFTQNTSAGEPIDRDDLERSFKLYDSSGPGGCDRDTVDGKPMLDHILQDVGDAWEMATTAIDAMDRHNQDNEDGRRVRSLLDLFFGVGFTGNREPIQNDPLNSQVAYDAIHNTFTNILALQSPQTQNLPRFRCLEDYAFYSTHMPNNEMFFAGPRLNAKMRDGVTFFSGLMFVHNPDGSKGWYMPNEFDQPAGGCGTDPTGKTSLVYGFSQNIPMNTALYGLTWCPGHFQDPTTKSMGNPGKDPGILTVAQIELYRNTGGTHVLHEFAHMVNNRIIDQPIAVPSNGDYHDTNWAQWVLDTRFASYGYTHAAYLGLARPTLARLNAENFAIFALCLQFPELDCLGTFQDRLTKRQPVAIKLPPRTISKIRLDHFNED